MVFNDPTEKDLITATIHLGGEPQTYRCQLAACTNPTCTCSSLTIYFFLDQSKIPLYTVEVDVAKRKLRSTPRKTKAFAKQLFAQLEDDDFQFLSTMHFNIKCDATEEADPKTIKASFDVKAIESGGRMYAYQEVLPFTPQLTAMIDDERYLLLDYHCLSSTCGCTNVTLSLFTTGRNGEKAKEHCLVQIDYKKKKWTMDKDYTSAVSIPALRDAAEQQIESFYSQLEDRHLRLKSIYFHNEHLSPKVSLEPRLKVGRNEPCPCGSGKKYKKCCLRNQTT